MNMDKTVYEGLGRFLLTFPDRERFAKVYVDTLQPYTDMDLRELDIVKAEDFFSWFPFVEIAVMLKLFQATGLTQYPNMLQAQLEHEALVDDADEWCMATEPWEALALAFCYFTIDYNLETMRNMGLTGRPPVSDGNLFSTTENIPSVAYVRCWLGFDEASKERFSAALWRWFGRSGHCLFDPCMLYKRRG